MPSEKRKFGDIGEKVAEKWLKSKGFTIVERNWWKPWGEIDIIAKKGNQTFFIEVKTVSSTNLINSSIRNISIRPEENIHPHKLKKLLRTIETYVIEKKVEGGWSVSACLVYLDLLAKKSRVEFLENIV